VCAQNTILYKCNDVSKIKTTTTEECSLLAFVFFQLTFTSCCRFCSIYFRFVLLSKPFNFSKLIARSQGAFFFGPPSIRLVHVLFARSKSIVERAKKLISRNVSCVNTLNPIKYLLSDRDKEIISGASSGLESS